jgi:hypothetical protein
MVDGTNLDAPRVSGNPTKPCPTPEASLALVRNHVSNALLYVRALTYCFDAIRDLESDDEQKEGLSVLSLVNDHVAEEIEAADRASKAEGAAC